MLVSHSPHTDSVAIMVSPASLEVENEQPPADCMVLSDEEIEKLGRQRPSCFKHTAVEIGFCISMLMSSIMAVCITTSIPPQQV
jgi:hypothetical protein